MKIPEDFKPKFVEALRSGNYKQGEGKLYNSKTHSYCCLGVAASLCGVPLEQLDKRGVFSTYWYNIPGKESDPNTPINGKLPLPIQVPEWLIGTINSPDNDNEGNPIVRKLAEMNDSHHTFDEIATVVEQTEDFE